MRSTDMAERNGDVLTLVPVGHVETDFPTKFGLPRQSGLIGSLRGTVVLDGVYADPDAVRGLEGYSHIWLLWGFSEFPRQTVFSPTVRPPRLGGNARMGVFATRSPNRPNPVALSCVKLERVDLSDGVRLVVSGVDMTDGTPVYDIKPYLPHTDCRPDAVGGFSASVLDDPLSAVWPDDVPCPLSSERREAVLAVLRSDPRPAYQNDPSRVYGFPFAGWEIRFRVSDGTAYVVSAERG